MQEGLTLGKFPLIGSAGFDFIESCQWLTVESDPSKQSWATRNLVPYSRTAYRLTINIPDSFRKKLIKAGDFVKDMPPENQEIVANWAGSENWYIYKGKIPAKWIVGCHKTGVKQ